MAAKPKPIDTIADLTPDARNPRKRGQRAAGMLVNSLHEVGAARSIVIDEAGNILAGNGTVEAAAEAGIERVQVVDVDGETLVAVRRSGLTAKQKRRLAILDNRTGELAEWDAATLAAIAQEGVELDDLWDRDELGALLAGIGDTEAPGAGGDDFDATPDDGPTRCKSGDLWRLGPHRLLCGDCTDAASVERLMGGRKAQALVTDPPYAVDYVAKARDMNARGYGHSRATLRADIEGDDLDGNEPAALERYLSLVAAFMKVVLDDVLDEHGAIYCWHASSRASRMLLEAMHGMGVLHHQTITWVKNNFVIGRCDYQAKHEPCFYGWRKGSRPPFYGPKNQTTVWEEARDTQTPEHPTQKPIAVMSPPMTNHLKAGQIAYDPFLGSGTTLIAAHRTGRVCYGIEIEPRYSDVVLRRAEAEGIAPIERLSGGESDANV